MTVKEFLEMLKVWSVKAGASLNLFSDSYPKGIGASVLIDDETNSIRVRLKDGIEIDRKLHQCTWGGAKQYGRIWARSKTKGEELLHFVLVA